MRTILMATLFALAALAPVATAHNTADGTVPYIQPIGNGCGVEVEFGKTSGADTSELPCVAPHIDTDRWGLHHQQAGVAGRYVASTGPLVDLAGSEDGTVFNVGPPVPSILPIQLFAVITTLCDAEATTGPGVPNPNPGDEQFVDNVDTGSATPHVPDGTWDDGGVAGACHVSTYTGDAAAYNDPGCPTGDYAVAEDAVLGESVEIGVGCDVLTTISGGGADVVGGVSCAVNALIFDGNTPYPDGVDAALECLNTHIIQCVSNGGTPTCANPLVTTCGSDGSTDFILFGEGGGHATPTPSTGEDGVQYPTVPGLCSNGGSAQVYTTFGVRAEVPALDSIENSPTEGAGVSISVPTVGWIDEVQLETAAQTGSVSCTGLVVYVCTYSDPAGCDWTYIWLGQSAGPQYETIRKNDTGSVCPTTPPGP